MTHQLLHRGPDDSGLWVDPEAGVALGHCRLSILDLSQAGHQPMVSADERYWLTYNGELYNHSELRTELECIGAAPAWRGHSDTETLLAVLAHFGVAYGLKRLDGMFAFALWDRAQRILYLARDRIGEKPLYYGRIGDAFAFGSELSALRKHPKWQSEVDRTALALFLRFGYVPSPWSIYAGVAKLPPASYVIVEDEGRRVSEPTSYWSLSDVVHAQAPHTRISPDEAINNLDALLTDSVKRRMQADVPIGCFLSGGIDSSTIAALMQKQSPHPIKTFTIGFKEHHFNEADHARAVAEHLGSDHTEVYLRPEDALAVVPRLPEIWDEPFGDSSQIPTYLLCKLARSEVKVALSGDGGDELFYGYRRYVLANRLWLLRSLIPMSARPFFSRIFSRISANGLDRLIAGQGANAVMRPVGPRLAELAELLSTNTRADFYEQRVSYWRRPNEVITGKAKRTTLLSDRNEPELSDLREMMMWMDLHLYLPDDILVKLDRASMAVSLETRVPLLDHKVAEFAWQVPMSDKLHDRTTKWLLRQVLYRYVPRVLVDRPKRGFGLPIEAWLRGPLRDWAEELLAENRLVQEGYLQPDVVRQQWAQHLDGLGRNHHRLWNVLMFQAWLAR